MFLLLVYTILIMAVTPIVYEWVNRQMVAHDTVKNIITGYPAYLTNLVICAVEALVGIFLPGGWTWNLWEWVILTALIYLGNQFVFNSIVKPFFQTRAGAKDV
jgi:hypothetical protein